MNNISQNIFLKLKHPITVEIRYFSLKNILENISNNIYKNALIVTSGIFSKQKSIRVIYPKIY